MIDLCCPQCGQLAPANVIEEYRNALGVPRCRVQCKACDCAWIEDKSDLELSDEHS